MKNIWWYGTFPPEILSVGDHAQTLAVEKFLAKYFADYTVNRFNYGDLDAFFKAPISDDDLILLHSCGAWGDLYREIPLERLAIIERYPRNRIIQLPVNVHYESAATFEADKIALADKPNVTILVRSEKSAVLLKANFGCHVDFFPDFVYYLRFVYDLPAKERRGVLFVLRNDGESMIENDVLKAVRRFKRPIKWLGRRVVHKDLFFIAERVARSINPLIINGAITRRFPNATVYDFQTYRFGKITDANREPLILDTLRIYQQFRLVVTDRFHGLVFASLANTPAIGLPSKISAKTDCANVSYSLAFWSTFRDKYVKSFTEKTNFPHVPFNEKHPDYNPWRPTVLDAVLSRRSVRKWTKEPIPKGAIELLKKAVQFSPTAANTQAVEIHVETDPELTRFLSQQTSGWFKHSNPPAAALIFYDMRRGRACGLALSDWTGRFMWQDTAAATMALMLTAESVDLKTCWASVNPKQAVAIKAKLGFPKHYLLTNMVFVGYSNQKPSLASRHQGRVIARRGQ